MEPTSHSGTAQLAKEEPSQQATGQINMIHDWQGADDPENPRNSPLSIRVSSIIAVTSLAFVSTFAGAIYAPAQDSVMKEFNCSYEVAMLPLALYNLGLAFGPLVGAPLSETFGRKCVFVATTPIFVFFMLGGGFSGNITSLTVCRFFAGMFSSSNINNASATILDYSEARHRGVILGVYYSLPSLGAALAPLVGGFILGVKGWRWTQWSAIIITAGFYVPVLFMRETYKKVILRRRAVRMGLSDTASQRMSPIRALSYFFTTLIQRPLHMLLTEPIVSLVSLYNGMIFGILYTFVTSVPWVFRHYYGFDKRGQSLSYLGLTIGTLTACVPFALIDIRFYQRRLRQWKQTHNADEQMPPEHRLLPAMAGSLPLPASLLIAGWTAQYRAHWIIPILFQGLTMLSSLLVYEGANLFMLDAYGPLYGASASAAMMLSRYVLSAAFPMFALRMFQALGAGWANTILAVLTLFMAPVPWCFWVFGERLRRRSRYERGS